MSQRLYEDLEEKTNIFGMLSLDGKVCSLGDFRRMRELDLLESLEDATQRACADFLRYSKAPEITKISLSKDSDNEPVIHFYGKYSNGRENINICYKYFESWHNKLNAYRERVREQYGMPGATIAPVEIVHNPAHKIYYEGST